MSSQITPATSTLEFESQAPNEKLQYRSPSPTICGDHIDKEKAENSDAVNPDTISPFRKTLILVILCTAQLFDIFNACAAIVSLPQVGFHSVSHPCQQMLKCNTQISKDLNFLPGTLTWILSGYTLTFAAFMLVAGRLADIYHPKPVFTLGFLIIGLLSIPIAASVNPVMLVVFRALQGIGT